MTNDPNNNYKTKTFFWKRKNGKTGSPSAPFRPAGDSPWTSWLGSGAVHFLVLLLILSAVQFRRPAVKGVKGNPNGTVGIVFSDEEPKEAGENSGDAEEPGTETAVTEQTAEQPEPVKEQDPQEDLIGTSSQQGATARVHINTETSDGEKRGPESAGGGEENLLGEGNGQSVGFGELHGKGKRFVYVLDRSKSMGWPDNLPIEYAAREAQASIGSLDPEKGAQKFQLVLYNEKAGPFDGGKRLLDVTPANRNRAIASLREISPEGGTDPLAALECAIRLAPDVIFFLTDAEEEISPMVLARIRELCRQGRVSQIHVMEFRNPKGKKLKSYQKLAEQNHGIHIVKDVTSLGQ